MDVHHVVWVLRLLGAAVHLRLVVVHKARHVPEKSLHVGVVWNWHLLAIHVNKLLLELLLVEGPLLLWASCPPLLPLAVERILTLLMLHILKVHSLLTAVHRLLSVHHLLHMLPNVVLAFVIAFIKLVDLRGVIVIILLLGDILDVGFVVSLLLAWMSLLGNVGVALCVFISV